MPLVKSVKEAEAHQVAEDLGDDQPRRIPYLSKEAFRSLDENGELITNKKDEKSISAAPPQPLQARSRLEMFREMEPKRKLAPEVVHHQEDDEENHAPPKETLREYLQKEAEEAERDRNKEARAARKTKQYEALERNAAHQKKLDAVEAEMERVQAEIDAEQATERDVKEAAAEAQKHRNEEHMKRLLEDIEEEKQRRDHAIQVLAQIEAEYTKEAALAEEEASHRIEVATQLKAVYAEVAQLCHISQLESMRSGSKQSAGSKDAREFSRYTGIDQDALTHAEARVGVADSGEFDQGFLRDHDARRGISPDRMLPAFQKPLATTGMFLGQPVGPRPPMDASKLLLGPSLLKSRAKVTRKETQGLVKNLMETDPSRYGIPSRFAPK